MARLIDLFINDSVLLFCHSVLLFEFEVRQRETIYERGATLRESKIGDKCEIEIWCRS